MSELEQRIEKVNTLIGLDLRLDYDDQPLLVQSESTGEKFWDGTIPFMLYNGNELLLGRSNFNTVDGYLSALLWMGTRARVVFE